MTRTFLSLALLSAALTFSPSAVAATYFGTDVAAFTKLRLKAEGGDARSSLTLATVVFNSCIDVPCDPTFRDRYLALAEKQGSKVPLALRLLQQAGAGDSPSSLKVAADLDQLASTSSEPEVWLYDAIANLSNSNPAKRQTAFATLTRAANTGLPQADRFIASLYFQGVAIERNEQKGLVWLASSLKKGDPQAANDLGTAYELGKYGLVPNTEAAISTYRSGANIGCASCAVKLSELLRRAGSATDLAEAARLGTRLKNAYHAYPPARAAYDATVQAAYAKPQLDALKALAQSNSYAKYFYAVAVADRPSAGDPAAALEYARSVNASTILLPSSVIPALVVAAKTRKP